MENRRARVLRQHFATRVTRHRAGGLFILEKGHFRFRTPLTPALSTSQSELCPVLSEVEWLFSGSDFRKGHFRSVLRFTMDPASQVGAIDEGIIQSEARIQREVAEYLALHPSRVGRQLAEGGIAKIPTFAGDYILHEADLRAIVSSEK